MANFWDGISNNNMRKNNFNLQEFVKFAQQMRGKDPNQMLQEMVGKGQITKEQLDNATNQANEVLKMIKTLGIKL